MIVFITPKHGLKIIEWVESKKKKAEQLQSKHLSRECQNLKNILSIWKIFLK